MAIEIREGRLPGIGPRWELQAGSGRTVMLVLHRRTGRRHLSIGSPGRDEPDCSAELSPGEAAALAGLLTDVRIAPERRWRKGSPTP